VLEGKNEVWKTIHVIFISTRKENSHDQGTFANDSLLYIGLIWQGSAPFQNGSGSDSSGEEATSLVELKPYEEMFAKRLLVF
jgi:hypothetical protein